MSVPKQHHTKGRRDRRRTRFNLKKKNLIVCSHCSKMVTKHKICPYCGFYKGKEIIDTTKKLKKKSKGGKEKKEKK